MPTKKGIITIKWGTGGVLTDSKRWRKWQRRRRLLGVRRAKRAIARILSKPITEARAERHNRLVKYVNYLLTYPGERGLPIIEGSAECPKCGREVWMFGDPDCWTERQQPGWRRRRANRKPAWKVNGYWGGVGECCGGFIASQPDGECHFYKR